jgi:MFS family permease
MMAVSCIVMANLPTYAQIGITAAWIMIFCRIAQGISSMGEIVAAQIYLTETIGRPARYPVTAFLEISADLGALLALGVAFLVTSYGLSWRFAFWMGAGIAVVGAFARIRLRETPDFLEMTRKWMKEETHKLNLEADALTGTNEGAIYNATWKEPVRSKTLISYFLMSCGWPLCFYLAFLYFNPILKENFGYSSQDIIKHNFFLVSILAITSSFLAYLSYRIHPLRINKIRGTLGFFIMVALPFLITNLTASYQLFLIQALILILGFEALPSLAVFMSHFPLYRRVTFASVLWSLSRALMYIITSFGLVFLGNYFGHFGLWIITLPTACAFLYGINHFKQLERKVRVYNPSIPPL